MWIEILLVILTLFLFLYRYVTKNFDKWAKLGLPFSPGSFPFGSLGWGVLTTHPDQIGHDIDMKFQDHKIFGWFMLGKPAWGIRDPEILKHIQVKDFNHFVDRVGPEGTLLFSSGGDTDMCWEKQLTSISGDEWKSVRSAFTPIFTSGKMKGMLKFIKQISESLTTELSSKEQEKEEFELKDVFGKFSLDALASSAFGVDGESFTNKDSVFVKHAAELFKQGVWVILLFIFACVPGFTTILQFFKTNVFKPKETRFFRDIIRQTIKSRRETGIRKNDMIDLMIDCTKNEESTKMSDEDDHRDQIDNDMKFEHGNKAKIDEISVVSTAMVLLIAGYDTTGMTLSFLSWELSKNEEVQKRLQEEIDEAFEDSDGEFPDYGVIQSLPYLDMCIHEALRKHNPVGLNTRSCNKDYTLPGTDYLIKEGDLLTFSPLSMHHDKKHYEHPDKFYPEHFSKEAKAARHPYAFQAFGQGPRACIGMRFALLEAKVAMMSVLREFSFSPGTKTKEPLVVDNESSLAWVKGGLWAKIERRN